jgi:uncharacterized delta-60 repeat protein
MKKIITISIYLLCIHFMANAQVTQEWVARYNGLTGTNNSPSAIAVDNAGNVYVTGYSGIVPSQNDYATIKYNSEGIQQWEQIFNGGAEDQATALVLDDSGNVYVTGYINSAYNNCGYATIKYNPDGVQQWIKQYEGPGGSEDKPTAIAVDSSGNVYVTGNSVGLLYHDYATIKYNSAGDTLWIRRYNGLASDQDYATALAIDSDGNVYVTGYSTGTGSLTDCATIKYSPAGVQQWVSRYNGTSNSYDYAFAISVDDSGNVYIAGSTYSSTTWNDYLTVKYNSSGVQQWVQTFDDSINVDDWVNSMSLDGLGNVYITGKSLGFATVKYNSSGVEKWVRKYNGIGYGNDVASAVKTDLSGNVYVTGNNITLSTSEFVTIKYNTFGVQQWLKTYDAPGYSYSYAMALDTVGNVYVTGKSGDGVANYDYATIKYVQTPTSVEHLLIQIPKEFSLSQNYPNPFNPSTKINYSIPQSGLVSLIIYDVLGKEAATLVNVEKPAGSYEVNFNASRLSSGVYFYKLQAGSFVETKKMMITK